MDNLNNIENSQSTRLKHNPETKSNRKIFIVIVFVIIVIAIALGASIYFRNKKVYKVSNVCGAKSQGNLLLEAGSNLQPQNVEKLKSYVDRILSINNYKEDPNCLYVVTVYYINLSDPENSLKYFNLLSPIYPKNEDFDESIARPILSKDDLNKNINALAEYQKNFSKNKAVRGE